MSITVLNAQVRRNPKKVTSEHVIFAEIDEDGISEDVVIAGVPNQYLNIFEYGVTASAAALLTFAVEGGANFRSFKAVAGVAVGQVFNDERPLKLAIGKGLTMESASGGNRNGGAEYYYSSN